MRATQGVRLNDRDSERLAELLPILACGEESASRAFARLGDVPELAAAHVELAGIERDERNHAHWLAQVRRALPLPRTDVALVRATRHFFVRMDERDLGRHFARLAALDSAVCVLLGALRRRQAAVGGDQALASLFARIHRDEAGHVGVARRQARRLVGMPEANAIAADTREKLVRLLMHRGDELEQLLRCDADSLFARLRRPARGLFA